MSNAGTNAPRAACPASPVAPAARDRLDRLVAGQRVGDVEVALRGVHALRARRTPNDLPSTLVIDHLLGLSFDETILPSAHERLARSGERARIQALRQILDEGPASEAEFTPLD